GGCGSAERKRKAAWADGNRRPRLTRHYRAGLFSCVPAGLVLGIDFDELFRVLKSPLLRQSSTRSLPGTIVPGYSYAGLVLSVWIEQLVQHGVAHDGLHVFPRLSKWN